MTSPLKIQSGRVRLVRSELPVVVQELEAMYNVLSEHGLQPSDNVFKLIQWLSQEAEVLKAPDYDPTFKCNACGFNTS